MLSIPPRAIPMLACFDSPSLRRRCPSTSPDAVGTLPTTTTQKRYSLPKPDVASLAPRRDRSGSINTRTKKPRIRAAQTLPQKLNDAALLASWYFFAPSIRDIRLPPPIPKRFAITVRVIKAGNPRETAATIFGSPSCPTKKMSARLYTIVTSWLNIAGRARVAIALHAGIDSNISCIFTI
jgi:hypothetical protein